MPKAAAMTRKSFFVNPRLVRRAKRALHVATEAEAVRLALERITEMEAFWRFMDQSRHSVRTGSFRRS